LFGRGGISVYVRELIPRYAATFPEDHLALWGHRLRRRQDPPAPTLPDNARLHAGRFPSQAQSVLARLGLGVDRLLGGADVVHWTDFVSLPASRAAVVATVHDVHFEDLPHCYTPAMRRGLRAVTTHIARHAARILVPSAHSGEALMRHFGVSGDRIRVVPHGVPTLPKARAVTEYGPYLLFVGTLEPRKNLLRLLEAHRLMAVRGRFAHLVLVGARGWKDEEVLEVIEQQEGVTWEGPVDRRRLAALYRGALALAYPSLGEGFGLPVLEAMSLGVPVVVGRATACAELAGTSGLAVDPEDAWAISEALRRIVGDTALRSRLAARGRRLSAAYTWEQAAAGTRAAYLEAAST
jgi:glycosyltransferase involved in cell wall biosynthesis